ncbi:hypothetical protein CGRA01v4_00903 [Colletotrichum graminicola]|nr:hypothetical protein CGRA01v4_00903 [Colletotrichum graminicola]
MRRRDTYTIHATRATTASPSRERVRDPPHVCSTRARFCRVYLLLFHDDFLYLQGMGSFFQRWLRRIDARKEHASSSRPDSAMVYKAILY